MVTEQKCEWGRERGVRGMSEQVASWFELSGLELSIELGGESRILGEAVRDRFYVDEETEVLEGVEFRVGDLKVEYGIVPKANDPWLIVRTEQALEIVKFYGLSRVVVDRENGQEAIIFADGSGLEVLVTEGGDGGVTVNNVGKWLRKGEKIQDEVSA